MQTAIGIIRVLFVFFHQNLHGVLPRAGRIKLPAFFDHCFQLFFDFCLRFPKNIFCDDLSVLVIWACIFIL